jgi:sugar phosphate isomerase/epimerase
VTSPHVPVLLSTSSVFPEPTSAAFEMAATLGYDGIEVMVWTDPVSQDVGALKVLSDHYGVGVRSVHAPCLLITMRVWSTDPWEKLRRSAALAMEVGASTVVVHPPFAWQRDYARTFPTGLTKLHAEFPQIAFAVENMYPVRVRGREFVPYVPGWNPTTSGFDAYTLDLSHCAAARNDALAMAEGRDEHLVPGRGNQPCAKLLESLASRGFAGSVAVEVATRRAPSREARANDLEASLIFAREHLGVSASI